MSPQPASSPALSSPPERLRALALAPEVSAVPDVFETLVISAVPPFERATALRAVTGPLNGGRSGSSRLAAVPSDSLRSAEPIRLTHRGRLVLVLAAIMLMLFGFSIGKSVSFASTVPTFAPSSVPAPAPGASTVVVQPGETLWAIATQVAPKTDPRVTIQRIIALNGLRNADVLAGQQLALPS